jgi:hypothetical protein
MKTTAAVRTIRTAYFLDGSGADMSVNVNGLLVVVSMNWDGKVSVRAPQNRAQTNRLNAREANVARWAFDRWFATLPAEFHAANEAARKAADPDEHFERVAADLAAKGVSAMVETFAA